ncbi:hypothetical protein MJO28_008032 [Puccinia striiformis f. sp. tritici]|uniref:UNC-50-like protein n=3 Tax=Puccinia striiformis TaxID=27350 RepID=A0A0L0VVR4_9BASI|nr:hypothetical protein Pst134EA_015901 [Puccinia striiformis f. sp. tritici]KAI9602414.1 hypothetical protein H4Q26_001703 [Puccinia striiformis f. sp. tritici PST-130]KNF03361.1 hypothetical protein PSTG_03304 [Puccinia striiformis f. sp. tritici PST-78]POV96145.1 hypothetical protein PSHT_15295 [Puccinia striiformis]KAH9453041.1 hypothetical protein Pst134EB_016976 [Puccinia striiformis f. sp. tritici]KAH9463820.1 hypothetical protein Pst134EA_015901 [Puccinia striiformis f. sp. tritici]
MSKHVYLPTSTSSSTTHKSISRSSSPSRPSLLPSSGAFSRPPRSGIEKLKKLISRLLKPSRWPTMDFELAAWQISYLCIAPRRVYRNVYYHKQTKNTWARDDPAILIILIGSMSVVGVLWNALYLRSWSPINWIGLLARFILRDFFLSGLIISTILWATSNQFFTHSSHTHATDQRVEWQYAFDIHTNSFFPLFINLYILQLVLAPLILRHNWVSLWIGNSLYLIAVTQYSYVTYLGYNSLPFLIKSEILLIPILIYTSLYFISLLGFNLASHFLNFYFSSFVLIIPNIPTSTPSPPIPPL